MFNPNLKPYPTYKPSGVEWLGDVPAHWEVRRLKYLLKERNIHSIDGDGQLLRVSQYTGVTQRKPTGNGDEPDTRAEHLVGYKCVAPNDLVVNIMLAWNGSMGVSQFRGITSPAYCVYSFKANTNPWYFHYLLRSPTYKARIKAVSTGVVESRLRLYTEDLYRLESLLPPLPEQTAIVRFLNHADQRIQRYIRAKQKLITLLEEQKQVIVHEAVTGRIDVRTGKPYPTYKDSGVEWLGEVPTHWEVRRLCTLSDIATGSMDTVDRCNNGRYPFFVRSQTVERINSWAYDGEAVLTAGDGVGVGKVFHYVNGKFDFHQRVYKFSNFRHMNGRYFFHQIRALLWHDVMQGTAKSTVDSLRLPRLRSFPMTVPVHSEQSRIANYLDSMTASIERNVNRIHNQIKLLQEYRTRLIADVVTGKLDVREAAAKLPETDAIDDFGGSETAQAGPNASLPNNALRKDNIP